MLNGISHLFLPAFVAFSVIPQMSEKIKMFFAMGPAYTLHFSISPIIRVLRIPNAFFKVCVKGSFSYYHVGFTRSVMSRVTFLSKFYRKIEINKQG